MFRNSETMSASQELTIEVAGISVSLNLGSEALFDEIRSHYAGFLSANPPAMKLDISSSLKASVSPAPWAGLKVSGDEIEITDEHVSGRVNLKTGTGRARITPGGLKWGLTTLLRNLFSLLLLKDEGIILHAAVIARNNMAYVFAGRSGSGKTTVANLSRQYTVLSDDLAVIRFSGGSHHIFPTPNWLDMQAGEQQNKPYKLAGLFKLVKDRRSSVRKMGKATAAAELMTFLHMPLKLQPRQEVLDRYSRLVQEVSCFRLHFAKDDSFWRCIDGISREVPGQIRKNGL